MKIYLAGDHAGFALKETLKQHLQGKGYEVEDCGALALNTDDDYPEFIAKAAAALSQNPEDRAIVIGGSGQGEAMVANKFAHVRCALFYGTVLPSAAVDITGKESHDPLEMLRLSREHNNANALSLGVRFLSAGDAISAVDMWLTTPFLGEVRHLRRIKQIEEIENNLV